MYAELKTDSHEAIGTFLVQFANKENTQAAVFRKGDGYIVEAWHPNEPGIPTS
jgi:hypothetical protein